MSRGRPRTETYRGLPRVEQVKTGEGSYAVVACKCGTCGVPLTRVAASVRRAERLGMGFFCPECLKVHKARLREERKRA